MLSENADVTGIDLSEHAIDYAREYYPGPNYRLASVTEPQGQFDWVVSFETLEHLPEPEEALRAFRESENLIISTPNEVLYPFKSEKYEGAEYPHIRHYTPEELDALLKKTGWNVVERHCQTKKRSPVTLGTGVFLVWVCR